MSWLAPLLLIAAQTTAVAPAPREIDPKVAEQVPIIAGKLEEWRGTWAAAGGQLGCRTIRSSGDEEIDALGCASVLACVRPAYPELKAIADGATSVEDKKRRMQAKLASLQPCMREHRGQGIAELALKRGRA
jgi:hypothetical protein